MRYFIFSLCVIFSCSLRAQVPQAIKYQAVARDSVGSVMANTNITVRISIIDSAASGSVVYSEIHKTGTNQFGLFNISIGRGITQTGLFANIVWATGSKWLQLEMSGDEGTTFTLIGSSELLSVPYALYAETSGNSVSTTAFNPLYPDGTEGMVGVTEVVTYSAPYVVPAGKNFYLIRQAFENYGPLVINGIEFSMIGGQEHPFIIMGPGDSISPSDSTGLMIFGYIIDATVTPVHVNLTNTSYVVPTNQQFFLTYCVPPKDQTTSSIQVNGFDVFLILPNLPLQLKGGTIVSISPIPTRDSYLNGFLK